MSTGLKAISYWSASLLQLLLGVHSEEGRDLEKQPSYFKFLEWSSSQSVRALQNSGTMANKNLKGGGVYLVNMNKNSQKGAVSAKTEGLPGYICSDVERQKCC